MVRTEMRRRQIEKEGEELERMGDENKKVEEEEKLTLELVRRVVRGVGALEAEEALLLQGENQGAPAEQRAAEAQALQQTCDQSEDVSHPHGGQKVVCV